MNIWRGTFDFEANKMPPKATANNHSPNVDVYNKMR